jgi:cell surface protein SprA
LILRRYLLSAAFMAAAAGGLIIVFAAPGTVSGSGQPAGRGPDPLPEFSESPPDTTPALWVRGRIPRTHADSLLAAQAAHADSTHRDSVRTDSLNTARRKFTILDTTYVVDKDSTERLRDFVYARRDDPVVEAFPERTYPLFALNHAAAYRREMVLDSTGKGVLFRETVGGVDAKIPGSLSLREYIALRLKSERRLALAAEARKTKVLVKKDIGDMLANITKISIPVPANPLFSIFGKNEINLNVTGAVDIKAGFRSTKSDQTTLSTLDQVRNEPDFNQEVQVNVNGTIGDKLNILADWNTKRTFEYENQLKIKYTGFEDEIVQSVEAGNVSLSTPSAFIGSSQALFGIKAKFQLGPLTLTALASQKKGQIKEVAVTGGAQERTFEMRAFEYATNHFFVDPSYRPYYEPYYQNEPPQISRPDLQIVEAEVWVQRSGVIPDPNERQAIAFISLQAYSPATYDSLRNVAGNPGYVETGPMVKLDPSQYELDGNGYIGELSLNVNVSDQQFVGIAYRTAGPPSLQYGELTRTVGISDTSLHKSLVLKMVKPKNLLSNGRSYDVAWKQLLKNIYPIPGLGRNLKQQGFQLDIFRQVPGSQDQNSILNEPMLRVMGFGKYAPDGTKLPVEQQGAAFDFRPQRTVSVVRAEIIFPSLTPFDSAISRYFLTKSPPPPQQPDSTYLFSAVYDTTQTFAQQSLANRYVIRGKATGEATSQFSLGFNVVEGSVSVLLDGRPLLINVDYTVDYIVGQVVIRNAAALVPGANLSIKYEQNDLFQLASKTLLGARADLYLGQSTTLGFTIMNLNQQTLSDKVRLGEEPSNNTIYGIDGSTTMNLPFLTRAIDAIPGLSTKEPSSLKISGEAAFMRPNPNTLSSTIPSDNGQGVAYIDDFEGARRTIPVGISYAGWTDASPPADPLADALLGVGDAAKMNSKGRLIWFNRLPTDVRLTDIYPRKQVGNPANDIATVLDLSYVPTQRGAFNYTMDREHTLTPARNWGGVMKPLSVSAVNLLKENINFIEVWMRVDRAHINDTMYIDLGAINEAVVNDGRVGIHGEDLYLGTTAPGILLDGEDVGLDMVPDAVEVANHQDLIALYKGSEPSLAYDPSGDDYSFDNTKVNSDPHAFDRINGTEGNANGPTGRYPDTEDINHNGNLDQANSYFEYKLSLDTVALRNPQIVGGGGVNPNNGAPVLWYQFRIPIGDYKSKVGSPTPENIEFVRCYFRNATDSVHVRIADFNLVGNQWQKQQAVTGDSLFDVSVVGVEQNPAYNSPPGVIGERDKTQTDYVVRANEQSLDVILKGVPPGQSRQAVKFYTYKALDLFDYRTMKMFVHGDPSFRYIDTANYDARMFFRFGLDSLNYYEYSEPIHQGWDPYNEVVIHFADITSIKQVRDSAGVISRPKYVSGMPPGSYYRVLGNPSLTNIVYLSIGVENQLGKGAPKPLYGEVWFDELRLIDVDNTPGVAWRMDTQLKLADLGSVAFNYSRVDPYFHTLEARFGSRALTANWGLSANLSLDKFFPEDWAGTTIPLSYSHSVSTISPKYLSNSDIDVNSAASDLRVLVEKNGGSAAQAQASYDSLVNVSQSRRTSDTYAAPGFHISLPSQAWYIRDTFNKLNFGFNYTKSTDQNPSVVYSLSWAWSAHISYAVSLPPDYFVMPFKNLFDGVWFLDEYKNLKIFFPVASFNWALSANRSRANSLQRVDGATEIVSRQFTMSRSMGFSWKLTEGGILNLSGDYSLAVESSLLGFELDQFGGQRPFSNILSSIFLSDHLINFGDDTRYAQHNGFNTKPSIPNIFNIKKFFDLSAGYTVDYNWQNTLSGGDLGKSAGWSNNINMQMNLKLKQLFDPLFDEKPAGAAPPSSPLPRGRRGGEEPGMAGRDTATVADTSARPKLAGMDKTVSQLKNLAKMFLKIPLLDYDNINITFTQSNQVQNSGVVGSTGFVNFWGRVPFLQDPDPKYGPSRLYQLGLISDPDGKLTNFGPRSYFPFFGWDVEPGPRAMVDGGAIVNTFRQTNRLAFKTSRDLWEGARIDLNWNVGWSYSRTQNLSTDSLQSIPTLVNQTVTGSVDRSFLTFPDVLFLGMFKTSLKEVSKQYAALKSADTTGGTNDEKNLTTAFEKGFEALPFLKKIFGQYYPRVNWSFRWDGLEKLPIFTGFVSRLSLDHTYNSNFSRQFENTPGGDGERTDGERVAYGFAPLVGANFTFKELLKGSFGANLRYNTSTSYDLSVSSRNIVETLTQEIAFTASYSRKGFEIPFFGLSLSNDVDVSLTYSISKNSRNTYDVSQLDVNVTGVPLEGSTRTQIEPRIKYVLSQRVTASVYYRYTRVEPDFAGSRIPGTTENEAGLDIHIAIQ